MCGADGECGCGAMMMMKIGRAKTPSTTPWYLWCASSPIGAVAKTGALPFPMQMRSRAMRRRRGIWVQAPGAGSDPLLPTPALQRCCACVAAAAAGHMAMAVESGGRQAQATAMTGQRWVANRAEVFVGGLGPPSQRRSDAETYRTGDRGHEDSIHSTARVRLRVRRNDPASLAVVRGF